MTKVTMRNGYDPLYARQFDALIGQVFGFSFGRWFEMGLWNEQYESYAILEEDRMLANVCAYRVQMVVKGKSFSALQLGGVATAPDQRGRGLSRMVLEHLLHRHRGTPMFLFANASVLDFYPRFGFRRVTDCIPSLNAVIDNAVPPVKLSLDDERLRSAILNRGAYSRLTDCLDSQSVQWFHLLMDYEDRVYYIEGLDAVVIAERRDQTLFLADVIAKAPFPFEALAAQLPFSGVRRVEFGFSPDWLGVSPQWTPVVDDDEALFVLGDWDLPEAFRIPVMSVT